MEKDPELIKLLLRKAEGLQVDLSNYSDDKVIFHYYLLFDNKSPQELENMKQELSSKNPGD
jgi:hypothetical protein